MSLKSNLFLFLTAAVLSLPAADLPGTPGATQRLATDVFPGFDTENAARPERKEPKWFAFWNGPEKDNSAEQFAWCQACEREGDLSAACKGYDALVREWPTAPQAARAQLRHAELLLEDLDYEESFKAYRYLLDFYSSDCDYDAVAAKMYQIVELMRETGKSWLFFHFANTVDVRLAYESLILRAPGASFVPAAMLTVAGLREDEGKFEQAVSVYENIRSLHPNTPEASDALAREARVRMQLLDEHGYNRMRVQDTIDFLKLGVRSDVPGAVRRQLEEYLAKAQALAEDEAWKAASFYDSRTRTRRSAVSAYKLFIEDYPNSVHAAEARERIEQLNGEDK